MLGEFASLELSQRTQFTHLRPRAVEFEPIRSESWQTRSHVCVLDEYSFDTFRPGLSMHSTEQGESGVTSIDRMATDDKRREASSHAIPMAVLTAVGPL